MTMYNSDTLLVSIGPMENAMRAVLFHETLPIENLIHMGVAVVLTLKIDEHSKLVICMFNVILRQTTVIMKSITFTLH